jgi:hypothetical protein
MLRPPPGIPELPEFMNQRVRDLALDIFRKNQHLCQDGPSQVASVVRLAELRSMHANALFRVTFAGVSPCS